MHGTGVANSVIPRSTKAVPLSILKQKLILQVFSRNPGCWPDANNTAKCLVDSSFHLHLRRHQPRYTVKTLNHWVIPFIYLNIKFHNIRAAWSIFILPWSPRIYQYQTIKTKENCILFYIVKSNFSTDIKVSEHTKSRNSLCLIF